MNIETVKLQGAGYLLNGSMHVPKADGNTEYELIKQWLAEGNTPDPEFTETELAEQVKQKRITELQTMLVASDYKETKSYMDSHTGEENKANYDSRTAWRNELRQLLAKG